MKRQLLTVILILLLLVSWVVIIDLARDLKDKSNALKIVEDFLEETQGEIEEMSSTIDNLIKESGIVNKYNEEAVPEYRR